jgi:uncharacterized protein (TIGR02996 family)
MPASRPEVIAFLQAIKEQPDDDTPRLILADWLEERGDPRGELLRLQVTLAHLIPGTKAWWERHGREEELRKRHEKEWLGDLAALVRSWTCERASRHGKTPSRGTTRGPVCLCGMRGSTQQGLVAGRDRTWGAGRPAR